MDVGPIRLKIRAVNAILRAQQPEVDARAQRIAAAAGEGFEAQPAPHKWTARAYVRPTTTEARRREADEKVLNRSLAAGR